MRPQAVRRRLAEEGSSYQKIKDGVRADLAKELLANRDLPLADIAERVGFGDLPALNRAFKNWTSETPAQYRKKRFRQV